MRLGAALLALGWFVLAIVGRTVLTGIPFWLGRLLPNIPVPRIGDTLSWRRQWATWVRDFPALDAHAFFATLLWPVVFGLNVVLLAQALEFFLPGGIRLPLPYFGSYAATAVVAGLFYSTLQIVLAVFAGESRRESVVYLSLLLIVVSLALEIWLARYVYYSIIGFWLNVDVTDSDSILSNRLARTMLVSLVVPVSQIALGWIAVTRFLMPMINYIPRLIVAGFLWLGSWYAQFIFKRVKRVPRDRRR